MKIDKTFLVTGHPRCGTGYMYKLLNAFGYELGHEVIKRDGVSSWLFAVPNDSIWIKEKRNDFNFKYVLHNVRNPYTALNSIAFTETPVKGKVFKKGVYQAYEYRKKYINIPENKPFYIRAAISFLEWNRLIEEQNIANSFIRVEDGIEMLKDFCDYRRIPYSIDHSKLPSTNYNGRKHDTLNLNHYFDFPNEILESLNNFCLRYGYPIFTDQVKNNYSHKMKTKVNNMVIYHHLDHIGKIIWHNKLYYEYPMLNYIRKIFRQGNAIDVGANIGNHSLFFSQFANKVYAFEPVSQNFKTFKRNIEENEISNIEAYEAAISNEGGYMSSELVHHNMGMCHLRNDKNGNITAIRGDDLNLENISLLKIDCENMSLSVLKSFEKTIEKNKPDLFIEADKKILTYVKNKGWKIITQFNATPTYHIKTG